MKVTIKGILIETIKEQAIINGLMNPTTIEKIAEDMSKKVSI